MTHHEQFCAWAGLPGSVAASIAHCEMVPFVADGQLLALASLDGTEIHFAAAPETHGRLITRRRIAAFLGPLLDRKGFLTTRVTPFTPESHGFLLRLGFTMTGRRGGLSHYMLCAVPYAR